MSYHGHVKDRVIVPDEPIPYPEGTLVTIDAVRPEERPRNKTVLRGTPYRFDDPISPAVPVEDWNACS